MADSKITDLTGYTPPADTDVMPIVDISGPTTKKITWLSIKNALKNNLFDLDTATPAGTPLNNVYRIRTSDWNFISNASFESWLSGTSVAPDAWTVQGTATIARNSTAFQGTYSALLTFGAASDGELFSVFGASSVVDYTYTAYVTRTSGTGTARFVAQQNFGSFVEDASVAMSTTAGQQLVTLTFKPSADGNYRVSFKAADSAGSTWRVDEVKVQESKGVATTWTPCFIDDSFSQNIYGQKNFKVAPIISSISNTGTVTLPTATDTLVARATTDTLTNKRITKRVLSAASYTTDTGTSITGDTLDYFIVTAQTGALKFNNPTGTPTEGQTLIIQVASSTTSARALTWDTLYEASTVALPTTTAATTAQLNIGFIYSVNRTKWVCVAVA